MKCIYLDYHASTPVDPRVAAVVSAVMLDNPGNAHSSDHVYGDVAELIVDEARQKVSSLIGAPADSVIFTSGATEAANLALCGFAKTFQSSRKKARVAVSAADHAAILKTALGLAEDGVIDLTIVPVDGTAHVDLTALEATCRKGVDLVAVIAASNEVGTITEIRAVSRIAHDYGALFLADAAQAVGKLAISLDDDGIDMLVLSAHKFYGPQGVGALIKSPRLRIAPLIKGGPHEHGLRAGTINVAGVAGMGEAARLRESERIEDEEATRRRRDKLQELLIGARPSAVVNGALSRRLAGNLHISFPGVPNQAVVARLRDRVAVSTGAACSSGIEAPSHVLRAMRLPTPVIDGAIRFGLGKFVSDEDVCRAAEFVIGAVSDVEQQLRR